MSMRNSGRPWFRDHLGLSLPMRLGILAVVLIAVIPLSGGLSAKPLHVFSLIALWAIVATGLNIVVGYAGQLNMANGVFFALGAYVGALGASRWEWDGLAVMSVAVVAAVILSAVISYLVFRTKGLYFALITTGLAVIVDSVLIVWTDVTNGSLGLSTNADGFVPPPLTIGPVSISTPEQYFVLFVWLLALLVFAITLLARAKVVFTWQSVRDDEVLAASVGVKVARSKRTAFVTSSAIAALAGVVFAYWMGYVAPDSFVFAEASVLPLAMIIIGGSGTLPGPIIGALIVVGLPEVVDGLKDYSILLFGAMLLVSVLAAPNGLVGLAKDLLARRNRRRIKDTQVPEKVLEGSAA